MVPQIKKLIISGGGIKGLTVLGAIDHLDEKIKLLTTTKTIIGSSIGAYIGFFLSIGLSIKKIRAIFTNLNFNDFQTMDIKLFLEKFGLDDGTKFASLLKATIISQNLNPTMTFIDLEKISKYDLLIIGTNISQSKAEIFSSKTTPTMEVALALRISGGYPFAFTPVEINGDLYADGAIACPLASHLVTNEEQDTTLGLAIHRGYKRYETESLHNYIISVISCIVDSLSDANVKNLKNVIEFSFPLSALSFDVCKEEKDNMVEYGKKQAEKWLENIVKK